MASQLEIQKRNLESSILFMQQEHAHTLRGLHEEISKLQKKCAELTFQLTMKSVPDTSDGDQGRLQRLEIALCDSELLRKKAELEVENSSRSAKQARDELHALEKQFADEMKSKNHRIAVLTAELDTKSGTIAYLTTELHKAKAARRSRPTSASSGGEPTQQQLVHGLPVEPASQPAQLRPEQQRQNPVRVQPQPPSQQRVPHRQLLLSDDGPGIARRRPISGRRLALSSGSVDDEATASSDGISSPIAVPDPTPFLQQQQWELSGDVVLKPTPPVLPPISSARRSSRAIVSNVTAVTAAAFSPSVAATVVNVPSGAVAIAATSGSGQSRLQQRVLQGLRLDAGTRAASSGSNEVGVLAVDRVSTTTGQPYAQEPGSAGCK